MFNWCEKWVNKKYGFFTIWFTREKWGRSGCFPPRPTKSNSLKLERKLRSKIYSWLCWFLPIYNLYFSMSPLNSSTIKFTLCLHDLTILQSNWFTIIMTMKRYSRANRAVHGSVRVGFVPNPDPPGGSGLGWVWTALRANTFKFEEFRKKERKKKKKKLCQHAWWSWHVTKTDWQMRGKISWIDYPLLDSYNGKSLSYHSLAKPYYF